MRAKQRKEQFKHKVDGKAMTFAEIKAALPDVDDGLLSRRLRHGWTKLDDLALPAQPRSCKPSMKPRDPWLLDLWPRVGNGEHHCRQNLRWSL